MSRDYTASCAICGGPGDPECPCEGERLKVAIDQAEHKWMTSWMVKTREWVTNNAINTITTIYNKKKEMRRAQYYDYVQSLPYFPMYEQYRGRPPLQPYILAQLQSQLRDAEMDLRRGIDADWKSCVVRYPEVLNHFYSQISVNPPRQAEPPFALGGPGPAPGPAPGPSQPPQRATSVNPQAQALREQAMREQQAAAIMRSQSTTGAQKKPRRQSKVNGDIGGNNGDNFDTDIFAQLSGELAKLKAGRGSPVTQAGGGVSQRRSGGQRPTGKRRESGGRGNAPPHVPQPPSYSGIGAFGMTGHF